MTHWLLGKILGEPDGDQLQDAGSLSPAAQAVQQLIVLLGRRCRVHPSQFAQNTRAREMDRSAQRGRVCLLDKKESTTNEKKGSRDGGVT